MRLSYGVLCDVVHIVDQGVLCSQNAICVLHQTHVTAIPFTPIRKAQPSLHQFSSNSDGQHNYIGYL
jgi:hypothetical protein